jgi:hypothetical protein
MDAPFLHPSEEKKERGRRPFFHWTPLPVSSEISLT